MNARAIVAKAGINVNVGKYPGRNTEIAKTSELAIRARVTARGLKLFGRFS